MADVVLAAMEQLEAVPAVAVVSLRELGDRHGSGEPQAVAMVNREVDVADAAVRIESGARRGGGAAPRTLSGNGRRA